jgi:SAM-dependent methyltransferase
MDVEGPAEAGATRIRNVAMPRVLRTVLPRIRASIAQRGVVTSLRRSVLLPVHLVREYRAARSLSRNGPRSDFDRMHGLDTDGEFDGWAYLSDLDIASPNWIHGNNYCGIEPERFAAVMSSLDVKHEDFVFIDFGSGKGRALLMASEFPFRRIIGIEFSPELHAAAERNIRKYRPGPKGCRAVESVCTDFLDAALPPEPSVLFFFDPCAGVLIPCVLDRIRSSLREHPRPLYLVYVAPGNKEKLLDAAHFLVKEGSDVQSQFCWYRSR